MADKNNLPPDLQALIAAEVARIVASQAPAAPREETVGEKARRILNLASTLDARDHSIQSASGPVHAAIIEVLSLLVDAVYPANSEDAAEKEQVGE